METLQSLIEQYGYVAVFLGCFIEGETVLVLAGFAAHLGYLAFPAVVATAMAAGFLGDQVLYFVGRRYGDRVFERVPFLARARPHAVALLDRWGGRLAFLVRFMVGMRIAGPIAIGAAGFPYLRYVFPNAAGAVVWATTIASAGYVFGHAFTVFLERARHYELAAFALLAAVALGVFAWRRRRAARRKAGA
jgi:membrane protein DedA with SNARE-associated domain